MRIELLAIEGSAGAREIEVMRPNLFRMAWYSALAVMGFKQSPLGGFGGMLMEYSGGAG